MAADDYAILVGITRYPVLGDLQGAEGDACRFREWLIDPAGGAVPLENVHLIVTSNFHPPEPASVEEAGPADSQFKRILNRIILSNGAQRERAGRRLYLYFSGHGFTTTERPEAALYTAPATLSSPEQIAGTRYLEKLQGAALFEELVLVMDCCRTMEVMSQIVQPVLNLLPNPARANQVRVFKAYGAPNGLLARERRFEPEGRVEGILTHALLAALRQAEGDTHGRVTGPQIKGHILNRWKELTRDIPAAQPEIDVTHAEELVFAERPTPRVHLVAEAADALTEVILIDHKLRRVAAGVGSLEGDFEPSFYKIKVAAGGRFDEQLIELAPGQETVRFKARQVRLQSAAPLLGDAPSAQREAAVECSRQMHREIGRGSQIFLFVRDPSGGEGAEPWRGVSVQTPAGDPVLDLEKDGVRSTADGYAGVNAVLDPGSYVLSVDTRVWGVQQMPLVAAPGWQTRVFLSARTMERSAPGNDADAPPERTARRADLFTASISMAPLQQEFDPASPSARLVEIARLALERGRDILRSGELREMLHRKLDDPVLGFLAGHMLLLAEEPDLDFLKTVLDNLHDMGLGQHPDFRALHLALRPPDADERFANPPMLRPGWRRIVKATAAHQDLIPAHSWTFRIAPRVIGNAAWLVWRRPGPAEEMREDRNVTRGGGDSRGSRRSLERGLRWISHQIEERIDPPRSGMPASYSTALPDEALSAPARRQASPRLDFLERNLLQAIESSVQASGGEPPDVQQLVQAMGLPAANIEELLKRIMEKQPF